MPTWMHNDRCVRSLGSASEKKEQLEELVFLFKKIYKTDRFLSWDNVDGSGPLKSLLSMYLQIKDRYHVSFKNMVTILNEKDAVTATK
jgi:hypothetical protein